jgi:Ig-like domain CHU_C associated
MKTFRFLAAALLLFFTAEAWAFRGRPVSDLRFEGRAEMLTYHKAAASDGTSFLVLSTTHPDIFQNYVVVQKVVDGAPAGPQRLLDSGQARSLAWTGSQYLAAWERDGLLWTAPLSREGTPLAEPQSVAAGSGCYVAVGTSSALAFCYGSSSIVRPLDLAGRPAGNAIAGGLPRLHRGLTVGPAAGGRFATVSNDTEGSWARLLNADGTPGPAIRLDDPGITSYAIATDGADTLITYTKSGPEGRQLKTAVLAANGTLKRPTVVLATEARVTGIARDGAGYAVLLEDRPLLVRITAEGARSGDPAPVPAEESWLRAVALASNSHAFLVMLQPDTAVVLDAATTQPVLMNLGRTLSLQEQLTIEAGPAGYLAAWLEVDGKIMTVRASRIDAAGNYLDGPGLVLDTIARFQPHVSHPDYLRIDASGPSWMVSWSDGKRIRAATVSYGGVAGETMTLGEGYFADLLRDGPHYLVLRNHGLSLYLDRITPDGTTVETRALGISEPSGPEGVFIEYAEPSLIRLGGRPVALFASVYWDCYNYWGSCGWDIKLMALRLDEPSATPVAFGGDVWGYISVATDGEHAVVMSPGFGMMFATILTAGNLAGTPFSFDTQPSAPPALAFDGRDFIALAPTHNSTVSARITASGSVTSFTKIPDERPLRAAALAASPTLPPLAGFVGRHPSYDNVFRANVLFVDELDDHPAPPPAPSIVCAARNADGTISVRWQPVANADGVSIELQLPDGLYRQIGVRAGGASGARVSTAGLQGSTVRVRAWNEGGLSAPSAAAPSVAQAEVNVRTSLKTCAGVPVTIAFTLSGIAPFTVRWSDGVVQMNLGNSATRTVTLTRDTTLAIVSVADAGCAINDTRRSIRVVVDPAARITAQPSEVRVVRGQSTTLTITAHDATSYEWFEGAAGDTSQPVDGNGSSFTTPALLQSTRYWVRVSNRCGAASSQTIAVTVSGKSRAVRR